MAADDTGDPPSARPSATEFEIRRYEARLGVWKVIWGTAIVGLAGVLIPGAVSLYSAYFDNLRKEAELKHSQQAAHQQYIKDFFDTAVNENIELRLRFAHYFANLSGPGQENLWKYYYDELKTLRDRNRETINELEKKLVNLKRQPPDEVDNAEYDRIVRELAWANAEIGYVPTERSAVVALRDNSPRGRKMRLYKETTDLVARLASGGTPEQSDLARFWTLYRRDLIGVESPEFARTMIAIGRELQSVEASGSVPGPELGRLADELLYVSQKEMSTSSEAASQPVQQQQFQQQRQQQQHQTQPQYQQLERTLPR